VWTEYGAAVGRITTVEGGWSGTGTYISWVAQPTFPKPWSYGPYCINSYESHWGWDGNTVAWMHFGAWGALGASYVWGCGTIGSYSHATIRIAASGYIDSYDDFGF
jgi:hypothetical protein